MLYLVLLWHFYLFCSIFHLLLAELAGFSNFISTDNKTNKVIIYPAKHLAMFSITTPREKARKLFILIELASFTNLVISLVTSSFV